jgi:hypothetical protein
MISSKNIEFRKRMVLAMAAWKPGRISDVTMPVSMNWRTIPRMR